MATGLETRFVTEFVFSFFLERNKPLALKKMVNFNSSVVVSISLWQKALMAKECVESSQF